MKLHTKPFLALAVSLMAALPPAALAERLENARPVYREGEVVVRYRANATASEIQGVKARLGLAAKRMVDSRRTELVTLPRFTTTAAALAVLKADPAVERAEPNFRRYARSVVPDDTFFGQQWGLRNTGQADFSTGLPGTAGADLNMANAWDANGDGTADRTGDPSVIVAVIDDAIQVNHPDLAANMVPGHNFIACQDATDPSPQTSEGQHGTLVSGCVAARGNTGSGVAGVAWNTSLMPLKFAFDTATFLQAMTFARDNGAKIINASFGGPGFSQMEADLITQLAADDVLFVVSAGNDDSNTDLAQLNYPANYDADNIVTVAATDRRDRLTSFSQYGPMSVDVAAPGTQVVTTRIGSAYSTTPGVAGTSFSSPYTAGVAALLKAHVMPAPGFMEMRARLIESGTAVGGANAKLMTSGGRVDADAALDMAARPALVITGVAYDAAGNGVLDAGETVDITFTVRNLWQDATNVTATLAVDDGASVTVNSGQQALGTIAALDDTTATFSVTVAGGITEHRYLTFTLSLAADNAYAAVRSARTELGTLALASQVNESFEGGNTNVYDDFHAWHVDVPSQVGVKTLFIRASTTSASDIDLLVKQDVPPQYSITVGINPESEFGFFCTSGVTADCQDPDTLVSARQDGVEEVSVVNPAPGTYHAVVVNFEQLSTPLAYTLVAEVLDGDLRPDPFTFNDINGVLPGIYDSNSVQIVGISGPTRITVSGGEYRIGTGNYTTLPGTVDSNQTVQLRAHANSGAARVQVTIGGVTDAFTVNLTPASPPDSNEQSCNLGGGDDGSGGPVPLPALVVLALAALARRLRAA